ncbi:family 10 glycosylhydrolase [bacterium]|nr:family 10 glycosylhydrolase [bacterium]
MNALAAMLRPLPSETAHVAVPQTRGYIINLLRGLSPVSLENEIQRAAQAGFNLLLFPIYNNGWTLFPSEAARSYGMKRISPLFSKWNPLATACRIAAASGLSVWAYGRPFNFHPRFSIADHKLLHSHPDWRLRTHPDYQSGYHRRYELWHPCPLNPDYRRYIGDVLTEVAHAYPITGAVLYYSSYGLHGGPLGDFPYCFCESCKAQYREAYPEADLAVDAGSNIERVRAWQLQMSHETLDYLRHRILRARRALRFICRARPHWRAEPPTQRVIDRNVRLMDWPELMDSGAVDELLIDPDDEPLSADLGTRVAADYAYLGDRVLFSPIVTVEDPASLRIPIRVLYRYPIPGFIAQFQHLLSSDEAQAIRESYFSEPAMIAEANPVRTAIWLLDQVRLRHQDGSPLGTLMADMLRILTRQLPLPDNFSMLQVIEQNLLGLEQFIRRGRLEPLQVDDDVMRYLGLARRFVRMAGLDVRA